VIGLSSGRSLLRLEPDSTVPRDARCSDHDDNDDDDATEIQSWCL